MDVETLNDLSRATAAVVRVGAGRGFVVAGKRDRMILTAAHCLPFFPSCMAADYINEVTYPRLIGPIGEAETTIYADCLFVDPIADIAVLGPPQSQEPEHWDAYDDFVEETCSAIPIVDCPVSAEWIDKKKGWVNARLLSLQGEWFACSVKSFPKFLWIENAANGIAGGMSGSPIITPAGEAIGMVCISEGGDSTHTGGRGNPRLAMNLPGWLLSEAGLR